MIFLDQERYHKKDKKPSVFAKKCDSLTSRAKHKASDRAHQAGENGAYIFCLTVSSHHHPSCQRYLSHLQQHLPHLEHFSKNTNRYANSSNNGCNGEAVFLEKFFQPLAKGQPFHNPLSLLYKLGSLLSKLGSFLSKLGFPLGIFCNSFTNAFTYRRLFIFVICNSHVLFDGFFNLFDFLILFLDFGIFQLNPYKRVESRLDFFWKFFVESFFFVFLFFLCV